MGEKNSYTGEFEVPDNFYIDIGGGPTRSFGHYKNSPNGDCHVTVYKSLDRGHGRPPVEHLVEAGKFVIKDVEGMVVSDFFREVRKGIEKIIDSGSS